MTFDIFEDKGNEGRVPSPPIPLSGEVEEVMPMGKSQGNVIARNAVTKQTPEGNVSPGPGPKEIWCEAKILCQQNGQPVIATGFKQV